MKEQPRITVKIAPNGSMEVSTAGVKGPACMQLTQAFEDALGGGETELTNEYYERESVQTVQQSQNG
jgi:hypothetical protein